MIPPIYITGAGVVSSLGCGKERNLEALRQGRVCLGQAKYLDASPELPFPVGEVPLSNEEAAALAGPSALSGLSGHTGSASLDGRAGKVPGPGEVSPDGYVPGPGEVSPDGYAPGSGKDIPRGSLLAILALREALEEAGIVDCREIPLISGTTVGGMDLTEKLYGPYSLLHDCGASTEAIASHFGGFSFATTISTACSSAANAFIFGANLIRSHQAQIVAVGGTESLSLFHVKGFASLMILDKEPCRPFDRNRAGLNLGEGAAYLILESEESMLRRGAQPLARLSGFGNACDAYHQTASSPEGEGAFLAMEKALAMAGIPKSEIGYVNAHGTATPDNDASESAALRRVFGTRIPPVSSTKALTGHTTSASGSIEAVFSILSLMHGFIPVQAGWNEPDPACIIPWTGGSCEAPGHVLLNAFGFGGNDTSLLFSKP